LSVKLCERPRQLQHDGGAAVRVNGAQNERVVVVADDNVAICVANQQETTAQTLRSPPSVV